MGGLAATLCRSIQMLEISLVAAEANVASHIVGKEIYQLIESVSADEIEAAEQMQNTLMP